MEMGKERNERTIRCANNLFAENKKGLRAKREGPEVFSAAADDYCGFGAVAAGFVAAGFVGVDAAAPPFTGYA